MSGRDKGGKGLGNGNQQKVVPNFPKPLSEFELFNGAPPGKTDKPPLAGKKQIPQAKLFRWN